MIREDKIIELERNIYENLKNAVVPIMDGKGNVLQYQRVDMSNAIPIVKNNFDKLFNRS